MGFLVVRYVVKVSLSRYYSLSSVSYGDQDKANDDSWKIPCNTFVTLVCSPSGILSPKLAIRGHLEGFFVDQQHNKVLILFIWYQIYLRSGLCCQIELKFSRPKHKKQQNWPCIPLQKVLLQTSSKSKNYKRTR